MNAPLRFNPAASSKRWPIFAIAILVSVSTLLFAPMIAGSANSATLSATVVEQGVVVSLFATNITDTVTITMMDNSGMIYVLPANQSNESVWQVLFPLIPVSANFTAYEGTYEIASLTIGFGEEILLPVEPETVTDVLLNTSSVTNTSLSTDDNFTSKSGSNKGGDDFNVNITLYTSFGGGASSSLPNLTEIRVYNVTGLATPRVGGTLVHNGTNTTFNITGRSSYRVEFTIKNEGRSWTIVGADVAQHAGLDSSWSVDTSQIWYRIDSVNYTGGTFSSGTVTWDTSLGGTIAEGLSSTWYYIVNTTTLPPAVYGVEFTVNDTNNNSGSTDVSLFDEVFIRELVLNASSVDVLSTEFVEGSNITLNISVFNRGVYDAQNFVFQAWDNTTGTLFYLKTLNVSALSRLSFLVNWTAQTGSHKLQFRADTPLSANGTIVELVETNNIWNNTINVSAWQLLMGNVTQIVRLSGATHLFHTWGNVTPQGIIYASDSDASISWSNLQALGRTTVNLSSTNDFAQADNVLGMTGYPDSVQTLFAQDASTPLQTTTRVLDGRMIATIPYINSTNTSSFITGIAWDMTLDSDGEFDNVENEDLVFFTQINASKTGLYGRYDYELVLPSSLQDTKGGSSSTYLYVEII